MRRMYISPGIGFIFLLIIVGCASHRQVLLPARRPETRAAAWPPVVGAKALAREIDAILSDSLLNQVTVGIKVVRARDGALLYTRNAKKLFHPASNMKLFTSAAALTHLGPNFRFTTRIATDTSAVISADTLRGNVYLVGSGNPDFSVGDLAYLIEQLYSYGIRYIDGDIICDDFLFDDVRYGNGWMWNEGSSDLFAPIGALTVQDNSVEVIATPADTVGRPVHIRMVPATSYLDVLNNSMTVSSQWADSAATDSLVEFVPFEIERRWQTQENILDVKGMLPQNAAEYSTLVNIVDPTFYFGTLFKELCQREGINISGGMTRGLAPISQRVLAESISEPLSNIITNMNKPSDNLSAEQLLKVTGAYVKGKPGTAEKGIQVIKEMLASWGADTAAVQFADGSGVSRYNLVSPETIVTLLAKMYENFTIRSEFMASLPIAGVDGTLSTRMRDMAAYRVVHAKTGSLNGVSTLSGYTQSRDGEVLAFSIMMAHFVGPAYRYRHLQDKICDVLTRFAGTRPRAGEWQHITN